MGPEDKANLLEKSVGQMAAYTERGIAGLKVFSYAFKDMEKAQLD
jgi:hypothetical protein